MAMAAATPIALAVPVCCPCRGNGGGNGGNGRDGGEEGGDGGGGGAAGGMGGYGVGMSRRMRRPLSTT